MTTQGDGLSDVSWFTQLIEGVSSKEELQELCRLLDFIAHEISHNSNFEFMQALLRLVLQVSRHLPGHI